MVRCAKCELKAESLSCRTKCSCRVTFQASNRRSKIYSINFGRGEIRVGHLLLLYMFHVLKCLRATCLIWRNPTDLSIVLWLSGCLRRITVYWCEAFQILKESVSPMLQIINQFHVYLCNIQLSNYFLFN